MKTVALSPLAETDISEIWDYTIKEWGLEQAITYTQNLRDACLKLASGQSASLPTDIRANYRKFLCGEHVIFFKEDRQNLSVIRILHKRMDVGRHL